jgi:aspartyl-tRNA(Asn)/glutamyl-tRNA(Gln) amidotransferase subunit C
VSSVPPTEADDPGPTLSRDDVVHLAHLARLELTDAELDLYVDQLSVILHSVTAVSGVVGGRDIEPTSHAVPLTNVFREDLVRPGLSREDALAGAPSAQDGRFRVPQILGEV